MASAPEPLRGTNQFGVHSAAVGQRYCLLALEGDLDIATAPQLVRALDEQLSAGRLIVRLNLAHLGFCDAAGLAVIVSARDALAAAGGSLTLTDCAPALQRLLQITGLTDLAGHHASRT